MIQKEEKYVCPETKKPLFSIFDQDKEVAIKLETKSGISYEIVDGIPNLMFPHILNEKDEQSLNFYDGRADEYDKYLHLTFKTHNENEQETRNNFIDALELQENYRVLDLACGTGRDSEIIAKRLEKDGQLFCLDISADMLRRCKTKLENIETRSEIAIANASHLPFSDNYFDAVYSFGGLGEFSDIKQCLKEMVRVTKFGGKIVIGDESIPTWLRNTTFAEILITTNPQFSAELPLMDIPVEARDVRLRWVIGGVFYLIDFRVGEGEPMANFDFEIPGIRGGSYRTRYEGKLEGVTNEAKELAYKAIKKKGLSLHKWLDQVVKTAALEDLEDEH